MAGRAHLAARGAAVAVIVVGVLGIGAAQADPLDQGVRAPPDPTPGVQSITAAGGETFSFLPVDRGRRWFPACPQQGPPDRATDVCGGTGRGERVYAGLTFLPDPADARCTVIAAHNDTVVPHDVVLPRKCYRYPLVFGVTYAAMLDVLADTLRQAVGSCPHPSAADQCDNPLARWPRRTDGSGQVDCDHVAAADLPPAVDAYTVHGTERGRLREVCAVLDTYLAGPPGDPNAVIPPTAAAIALGDAAFDLYGRGGGTATTQRLLNLGLFTVNLTEACAAGSALACGLAKTGAAVDCAAAPMDCLTHWLATGATSAVRLLGEVIAAPPPVDLTDPAFRGVYQPLGVTSAYLALLLLLISGIVSAARLDYSGVVRSVVGVFRYALGLAAMLTLTVTALNLAHALSTGIAGDQASLQALTTRFEQAMQGSLTGTGGAPTAFVAILALLVLLAAAFTWLVMNGRKAGILILCAFSPILLAGQAGPEWARAWAPRAVKLLAAIIFAQPVATIFYRLGVGLMAFSPGPGNVVTGLIILLLVGFAPWMLLAFIGLTTQALANEQTRARGGHGGGALSMAGMAALTMRANSPAHTTTAAPAAATASVGGLARVGGTVLAGAYVAQQAAAHVGDQVTTAGGATGDAPRAPQLAHLPFGAFGRPGAARQADGTPPPAPPPPNPPSPPPDPEPLAPAAHNGWVIPS